LIDEPVAGIDKDNRLKIIQLVKQLKQEGKTILQIEHHPEYECDWVYDCHIYGRLYDWQTAMGYHLITNCGGIPEGSPTNCIDPSQHPTKGICPTGWHIPSKEEWEELYNYVSSNHINGYVGSHLKAKTGWEEGPACSSACPPNFNTPDNPIACSAVCVPPKPNYDTYGFAALPGGFLSGIPSVVPVDPGIGKNGYWWTSSSTFPTGIVSADYIGMSYDSGNVALGFSGVESKMSVRCVGD
jgi:uncharacterized protein (TIGR02145 family)